MAYIFDLDNHFIEFDNNCKLNCKIVISSKAKRIILKVKPTAELEFVIPKGMYFSKRDMLKILENKAGWIENAFKRIQARCENLSVSLVLPEKIILPVLGESWSVKTQDLDAGYKGKLVYITEHIEPISAEKQLIIHKNIDDVAILSKYLQLWLRRHSKEYLSAQLCKIAELHDFTFNKVTIKSQRTKWGSCSSRGNINLNFKLILLDEKLIDYLILHELCHLKHMNHSSVYKNFIRLIEPDSKFYEKELNVVWHKLPQWILV